MYYKSKIKSNNNKILEPDYFKKIKDKHWYWWTLKILREWYNHLKKRGNNQRTMNN